MSGLRRTLSLFLVPLLIALLAVPALAAPQKEKTNEDHEAWFVLDPVVATTDATSVTITGKVAGNFDMTVTNGAWSLPFEAKGQFSVTVPLDPGANSIQFSGLNNHGRYINHSVTVTREVQEPEPTYPSSLTWSLTGTLVADGKSTATLTVTARDASGAVMTNFNGPVFLVPFGAVVGVEQTTVYASEGVATFVLRAGTQAATVSLTLGTPGVLALSVPVTVEPVPPVEPEGPVLTSLSATVVGALVADGQSMGFVTVSALDQNGTLMTGYTGPITVTSADVTVVSVQPGEMNAVGGTATFQLRAGTTAGTVDLTVSVVGLAPVSKSVTVAPVEGSEEPVPSHLSLSDVGILQADGQSQAMLYVTVTDSAGNPATNYAEPITVTTSNPSILTAESGVIPVNGVATVRLQAGTVAGTATIVVSAPGLVDASTEVTVEAPPAPELHLDVSLSGTLQVNNSAEVTMTIRVLDPAGQIYTDYDEPITVVTSNSSIVQVGTPKVNPADGVATAALTAGTLAGTASISIFGPGLNPYTVDVTVAAAPPPPLGLSLSLSGGTLQAYSGNQATLTVRVVNTATGQVQTSYTDPLSITSSNSNSVRVLAATVVPTNGVATTTLASGTTATPATITVSGPGLTAGTVVITPLPPAPARMELSFDGVLVAGSGSTASLRVTVYDAAGQVATNFAGPISITSSNSDSVLVETPSVTPINGIAVGSLRAGTTAGTATITVSANGLPAAMMSVTVDAPMPPHLNLVLVGALIANNQSQATLNVTVVDADGAVDRTFAEPITFASSNPAAVQVLTPVVTPVGGVATVVLKAGASVAPAVITGTGTGLLSSDLTVTPAPQVATHLTLVADPTDLGAGTGSQGALYLGLKDQTGVGMLALGTPLQIRLTTSNAGSIHFGNGQSALDLTMTTPTTTAAIFGGDSVGSAVITGQALGASLSADSITVNSVTTGVPYQFSIDPVGTVKTGASQVITIRLLDVFGYQVTSSKGTASATLKLVRPDGTTTTLGTVAVLYGIGTFTMTAPAPGQYTLQATGRVGGYPMLAGESTLTVTP